MAWKVIAAVGIVAAAAVVGVAAVMIWTVEQVINSMTVQ